MGKLVDEHELPGAACRMASRSISDSFEAFVENPVSCGDGLDRERIDQGGGFDPAVGLDDADNGIDTLGQLRLADAQHLIGFADPGGRADEKLEAAALFAGRLSQ